MDELNMYEVCMCIVDRDDIGKGVGDGRVFRFGVEVRPIPRVKEADVVGRDARDREKGQERGRREERKRFGYTTSYIAGSEINVHT